MNYHPDFDRPIANPIADPEDFVIHPDMKPTDPEQKPGWKLKDIYPEIADFRRIPTSLFTDPAYAKTEWDKVWTRTWLLACHVSDLKNVGDWYRYDIGRESIIVTRTAAGIKAHYNVCRHRAAQLVIGDFGRNAKAFTCPYHGWRFGIDGKNEKISDPGSFPDETLCDGADLVSVHADVAIGFVFVHLGEKPEPLADYLGDVTKFMANYKLEDMIIAKDAQIEIKANWKAALEPFQEVYHAQATHPQTKPLHEDYYVQYDFYPNGHNRMIVALGQVSHRLADRETVDPSLAYMLRDAGIADEDMPKNAQEAYDALVKAKRRPDNVFGIDYSRYSDGQLNDDWNVSLFPNITFNTHPEGVLVMRFRPHPEDVNRMFYDVQVLVPKMAEGKRPPVYMGVEDSVDISGKVRPPRLYLTLKDTLGEVLDQDKANLERVQRGIHSKGMGGVIRLGEQERRNQQFYAEMNRYVTDKKQTTG